MRKVFNKVMAGAMTTALVATLAVGFKVNTTDVKADTANALTGSWTSSAESYEPNDAVITQTTFKSTAVDNVSANISITGWQANWTAESAAPEDAIVLNDKIWGEKPYQIKSEINAKVVPGNTYKLKFTVNNGMMEADTTTKTEKNITITVNSGIEGDNDNIMLFKTITVPAGETKTYEFDVPVSPDYLSNDIKVQLAYGSYYYSYELTQAVKAGKVTEEAAKACKYAYAYGTSENVNAHGTLAFTDISLMGEKYTQSVIPERQTPKAPTGNTNTAAPNTVAPKTVAPNTVAPTTAAPAVVASKPAQVKKVKAVNNAKKSVKVTWKKVKGAKSYQVKVGNKKYNAKKTNVKIKKLAVGKSYKVQVRAKNAAGFGKWSKAVKVTIKK
ncbi:fibronectin type III domain-containing protein [Eubacterium sp. AF17-7]|uniref:fibronectin type III domain-containing protein n=1 Tax=Eubacterium sp. AF17-7 TaxID=2293105 RepID=UPI000E4DB8BD|nr:fibronectin type III domain-containing protein [Eubacterium sp. AF17-7]RGG62163.1 fibronectin type III domain-containing protein [Eubacterium sp. AF17-7]